MAIYVHNESCITPIMTSHTAPVPVVISAKAEHSSYQAWKAFNQNNTAIAQGYLVPASNLPVWLKVDLGSGVSKKVKEYTVSCFQSNMRCPKDWTLEGSNNDVDWDVLDTVTGETGWASSTDEMRSYTADSPGYYRYYQLNVSANNGDSSYLNVGELELIEADELYYFSGYVTENGTPVSRKVSIYDRLTGGLEATTVSSGSNGYYYIESTSSGTHFIVAFDDDAGEDYNALILDKLLPQGVV